jgi:hypothetical protein
VMTSSVQTAAAPNQVFVMRGDGRSTTVSRGRCADPVDYHSREKSRPLGCGTPAAPGTEVRLRYSLTPCIQLRISRSGPKRRFLRPFPIGRRAVLGFLSAASNYNLKKGWFLSSRPIKRDLSPKKMCFQSIGGVPGSTSTCCALPLTVSVIICRYTR